MLVQTVAYFIHMAFIFHFNFSNALDFKKKLEDEMKANIMQTKFSINGEATVIFFYFPIF